MEMVGSKRAFKPEGIAIAFDHLVPRQTSGAQKFSNHKEVREGAQATELHDVGYGIPHQVLVEDYVVPGQVVIVADSHASTSRAWGLRARHGR